MEGVFGRMAEVVLHNPRAFFKGSFKSSLQRFDQYSQYVHLLADAGVLMVV